MKILLFDFDGVIIDTLPIAVDVYNELFKKYTIPYQFNQKSFSDFFLTNFHKSLTKLIKNEELCKKILDERAQKYIERENEFKLFDGIKNTLKQLSQIGNIIIISSNESQFIKILLKNRGITCIQEVLGADIEKSKVIKIKKQKEKYPNSEIYYIGDTVGDIKEGKKAGIKTIAVSWGFHTKKQLEQEKPNFLIDKPKDLSQLFLK